VLHNLTEGIILVALILFVFLGNIRGAFIVALTIPFSLLFASICLNLNGIPANLLSLGALDFGMVVEGAVVDGGKHHSLLAHQIDRACRSSAFRSAAHEVQRPVFYSIAIIITAYVPIFTLQRVEGRLFKDHGVDGGFRAAWIADFLDADRAGDLSSLTLRPACNGNGGIPSWPR